MIGSELGEIMTFESLLNLLTRTSKHEISFAKEFNDSLQKYKTIKVVGRGTVKVDPQEIISSPQYLRDVNRAKKLFSK